MEDNVVDILLNLHELKQTLQLEDKSLCGFSHSTRSDIPSSTTNSDFSVFYTQISKSITLMMATLTKDQSAAGGHRKI